MQAMERRARTLFDFPDGRGEFQLVWRARFGTSRVTSEFSIGCSTYMGGKAAIMFETEILCDATQRRSRRGEYGNQSRSRASHATFSTQLIRIAQHNATRFIERAVDYVLATRSPFDGLEVDAQAGPRATPNASHAHWPSRNGR